MIHRITIEHRDPKAIIAVLKRFTDEVMRTGKLPPMQVLSDDKPHVVGSVVTFTPNHKDAD